jgi:hypothetical protein
MNFDPDMTYWQSLRIVARGLIQNPIREGELEEFVEGLKNVLYYGLSPVARLVAMLFLPIAAPLLTLIVQVERRKTAERIAKQKREMRSRIHQFGPEVPVKEQ